MGLFSDKDKQAEKQRIKDDPEYALKVMKEKLGIDFDSYSDEELSAKNAYNIERLRLNPATKMDMDIATTLAGASTRDLYAALRGLLEQNWIIIRQNEQIVRELKRRK